MRLNELPAPLGSALVRPDISLLGETQRPKRAKTTMGTSLSCPLRKHLVFLQLPKQSLWTHGDEALNSHTETYSFLTKLLLLTLVSHWARFLQRFGTGQVLPPRCFMANFGVKGKAHLQLQSTRLDEYRAQAGHCKRQAGIKKTCSEHERPAESLKR